MTLAAAFGNADVAILVGAVLLLTFGAFLSAAEVALTRTSHLRALALVEEGRRGAVRLAKLVERPSNFLNVVLLLTLVSQQGAAFLVAIETQRRFSEIGVTAAAFGLTLLTFVFQDAMPKTYAIEHSDRVALAVTPAIWPLARLCSPLTSVLIKLSNVILPGKGLPQGPFTSEAEIRGIIERAGGEAVIEAEEARMIHQVFEFGDTVVREVMTPRTDMVCLAADATVDEALGLAVERGLSRIPVHSDGLDDVVGLLYVKDILSNFDRNGRARGVAGLVRPAHFVPEQKRLADLLSQMQMEKFHMAIVVDEHGGTAGLVTMEDLLEELVGDITDEYDTDADEPIQQRPDGSFRVAGRVGIDDLAERLGIDLDVEDADTVGGAMLSLLGDIPDEGEEVEDPASRVRFRAVRVKDRRIEVVDVVAPEGAGEEAGADPGGDAAERGRTQR